MIESAVNFACISPLERRQLYVEFLPDALLATDTKGRYEAYKTAIEAGFLTIAEIRAKENLPQLPESEVSKERERGQLGQRNPRDTP